MHHMSDILQRKQHPFYRQELKELLRQLGLERGDTVMLHASLKAFGYLIGGAETIIEALLSTLGPEGTLVMPSQTVGHSNPRFWQYPPVPKEWHEKIRDSILPYDPERTPSIRSWTDSCLLFAFPQRAPQRTPAVFLFARMERGQSRSCAIIRWITVGTAVPASKTL